MADSRRTIIALSEDGTGTGNERGYSELKVDVASHGEGMACMGANNPVS